MTGYPAQAMELTPELSSESLPDVAAERHAAITAALEWVGMEHVELPLRIVEAGVAERCVARARVGVDLVHRDVRGIHMSRLYRIIDRCVADQALSVTRMRETLTAMLESHVGLSSQASLQFAFDLTLRRPALVSDNQGWRSYPACVHASLGSQGLAVEVGVDVLYSSTCPSSSALARQLIQQQFRADFAGREALDVAAVEAWLLSEGGLSATPHAQRSRMQVRVRLAADAQELPWVELIDLAEKALATPVQTAVKREDERAFAALNGRNVMFCEDAVRKLQSALAPRAEFLDFWLRAAHFESLHPHDAVALATKGVAGGYSWRNRPLTDTD